MSDSDILLSAESNEDREHHVSTDQQTVSIKISPFIAGEAEGSSISDPGADSGYDEHLGNELHRVGNRGGMVHLTRQGLLDLAEWLDAMYIANQQSDNQPGATSCSKLAEKARNAAREMSA